MRKMTTVKPIGVLVILLITKRIVGHVDNSSHPAITVDIQLTLSTPANAAGLNRGIIGLCNKGQSRKVDDWGALHAWAWGASRALDYFATDKSVDASHVGLEGHSRYGKATLTNWSRYALHCYSGD